ncbi:hypothetical protein [Effusibacillus dendaii]|uniref:Uncharacterized protein n=1 Tax=Effusibacillus dendaii TaxID=2743772 RepID=A0A7I8DA93_9BACL|nr:hypothetical protein [Effusibacillus dendaii]BCJ87015.1 hypothetical protein skT53_20000 [Effusibacillus dendaii]
MVDQNGQNREQASQSIFEEQRQELLQYKDQLSKSMRPEEAEANGNHLAATVNQIMDGNLQPEEGPDEGTY